MRLWFNDGPMGISGDEDSGEESSWYVLSAMGFFPVCPGQPFYAIGSPMFEETRRRRHFLCIEMPHSDGSFGRSFEPLGVDSAQIHASYLRRNHTVAHH
jgi:hypothetical protein